MLSSVSLLMVLQPATTGSQNWLYVSLQLVTLSSNLHKTLALKYLPLALTAFSILPHHMHVYTYPKVHIYSAAFF